MTVSRAAFVRFRPLFKVDAGKRGVHAAAQSGWGWGPARVDDKAAQGLPLSRHNIYRSALRGALVS